MKHRIKLKEIRKLFNEFVEAEKIKLKKRRSFVDFVNFLEIDFYDWVRENLGYYFFKR